MKILILNGPNLNLLGQREKEFYGSGTTRHLETLLKRHFPDVEFTFFQSNREGELIDQLHGAAANGVDGVVFNPGGYTHTSVALRDAVIAIETPVVEAHVSNVAARESFRHVSLVAPACEGQVVGFGLNSYVIAVHALALRA